VVALRALRAAGGRLGRAVVGGRPARGDRRTAEGRPGLGRGVGESCRGWLGSDGSGAVVSGGSREHAERWGRGGERREGKEIRVKP
jgi:hypothetical protein